MNLRGEKEKKNHKIGGPISSNDTELANETIT